MKSTSQCRVAHGSTPLGGGLAAAGIFAALVLTATGGEARVREARGGSDDRGDLSLRRKAQDLVERHGLLSIEGPAITLAGLEVLETAVARFRRQDLKGLVVRFENPTPLVDEHAVWIPFLVEPREGFAHVPGPEPDPSPCEAQGGEIRIFQESPQLHVLVHEIVHHVTLVTDRSLLVTLAGTLGYGVRGVNAGNLCERLESDRPFSEWRVAASSHPNEYSYTNVYEHVAEIVALRLATRSFEDTGWPIVPGFTVPRAAIAAIDSRFSALE